MATMTKKSSAKKATKAPKAAKVTAKKGFKPTSSSKVRTRSQVIAELAAASDIKRTVVKEVFDNLSTIIGADLGSRGPGVFSFFGLMKMKTVKKPATKERTGVNPFTGETQVFKAKPASKKVRVRPTKALNALVG
ncbi:MAG: integration host factor [Phycisphaerales bacterium]|nr:integration host factor [Phycisphaerales bacterium]